MDITSIGSSNISAFSDLLGPGYDAGSAALGAVVDGVPAGVAAFHFSGGVCIMDNLHVRADYRRKHIASALMDSIAKTLILNGISDIMAFYNNADGVTEFLKSMGFAIVPGDPLFSVPVSKLLESPLISDLLCKNASDSVRPFSSLSGIQVRSLKNNFLKSELSPSFCDEGNYDNDVSFAFVKDNVVTAVILASKRDYDVDVTAFYSGENNRRAVLELITAFSTAVNDEDDGDTTVNFIGKSDSVIRLITQFVGEDDLSSFKQETFEAYLML